MFTRPNASHLAVRPALSHPGTNDSGIPPHAQSGLMPRTTTAARTVALHGRSAASYS